jgi:protein involved in polysaccharide export with SLBB domain
VLNLAFFGETNLTRTGVIVGPDGRINYLQAQDIVAAGLTVDELREALDTELGQFYRSPRTMVVPVAYNSKRYYVLGRVMNRGVFALDRPMTVVEALARAQGVETGMLNRDSVDLADLQRSFLIRRGERVPINFEKLFQEGDLSQNILIEPDDYLYFPPAQLREVYVVGEVRHPGVLAYTQRVTAIAAISHRGGFTERAYKRRVLVVRGSINEPETFIVDLVAILEGREPDFQLEPRDIIYASHRPFIRVEELLDLATRAFIQSAVTTWAGANVGPILTRPLVR